MTFVIVLRIILAILMLISGIAAIILVLFQSSNSDGTSALSGGGSGESFYQKNKGRNKESQYKTWTFICAGLLAVCSIVFFILGL
jgi:preprotein translocase subunit SecG